MRPARLNAGYMTIEFSAEFQRLIKDQGGVFSTAQAAEQQLDEWVPRGRLRTGDWQRLHRGVYTPHTGRLTREEELYGALLRAGIDEAVLSHYTAAERHGFLKGQSYSIHIAVPERSNPARYTKIPGVIIHRSDAIVATCHPAMSPRCTRVDDTVLDILKITKGFDRRFDWICRAVGEGSTTPDRILARLAERKRFPGREELQLMLGFAADGIRSWLELQWAEAVERPHGIPRPERQVRVVQRNGSKYLDNLYREFRLCVELDGRTTHPEGRQGRDKARDRWNLINEDIVTIRFETPDLLTREQKCQAAAEVLRYLNTHNPSFEAAPLGHPCSSDCPVTRSAGPRPER